MEWDFFWLVIILLLSFVEVATVNLVTIWFIVSALVALLLAFFNVDFIVQFAVFVILGVILLVTTRSYLEKLLNKPMLGMLKKAEISAKKYVKEFKLDLMKSGYLKMAFDEYPRSSYKECLILYNDIATVSIFTHIIWY